MSATPDLIWTGYFASSGSPALKITVSGPFNKGQEYEAIIDTGFTGFLSLPMLEGIRLGLVLYSTARSTFADGSTADRITARGQVTVGSESQIGVVILEPQSTELLLGMGFLRQFKRMLAVTQSAVGLWNEPIMDKMIRDIIGKKTAPPQAPPAATPTLQAPTQKAQGAAQKPPEDPS